MTRRFKNLILIFLSSCLASALLSAACFAQVAGSGASEGLVEVLHRVRLVRGAELVALVSRRVDTTPTTAVLLFAGSPGILRLREENGVVALDMGGNFLIRARRHLNSLQVFTVAVDCPSDQQHACDDRYRTSADHVADIRLIQGQGDPRGDPCQARSQHGFVGRERVVMRALHDWVTERLLPEFVGAAGN